MAEDHRDQVVAFHGLTSIDLAPVSMYKLGKLAFVAGAKLPKRYQG
jgi:hypothetical protein